MIIEKISIKSFGMITDMSLDFADDVIVMQSGRIVMQGSPCDIVESDVIRDIFGVGVNQRTADGQTRFEYDY